MEILGAPGRHARCCSRQATCEPGGPALRCASCNPSSGELGVLNLAASRRTRCASTHSLQGSAIRFHPTERCGRGVFPTGHRIRVALSTSYWPMIWPSPEKATVTVFSGDLELPVRAPAAADVLLSPLPGPETAPPEPTTKVREGVVQIDGLGLELSTEGSFNYYIDDDDPLVPASRNAPVAGDLAQARWRIRIETEMKMSCNHDALMQATMRAFEGDIEVLVTGGTTAFRDTSLNIRKVHHPQASRPVGPIREGLALPSKNAALWRTRHEWV